MGYGNQDLEEIPTKELQAELSRRAQSITQGKCPYCNQPLTKHTCKYAPTTAIALARGTIPPTYRS
jgi:hypothetical protein